MTIIQRLKEINEDILRCRFLDDAHKRLDLVLPEIISTLEAQESEIKSSNERIGGLFTASTSMTNKIMELREAQRLLLEKLARQEKLLKEGAAFIVEEIEYGCDCNADGGKDHCVWHDWLAALDEEGKK